MAKDLLANLDTHTHTHTSNVICNLDTHYLDRQPTHTHTNTNKHSNKRFALACIGLAAISIHSLLRTNSPCRWSVTSFLSIPPYKALLMYTFHSIVGYLSLTTLTIQVRIRACMFCCFRMYRIRVEHVHNQIGGLLFYFSMIMINTLWGRNQTLA